MLDDIFKVAKPVIGMVHLKALPASPSFNGSVQVIVKDALKDAQTLWEGGVDGLLVENYHDAPFYPDNVPPHVIAFMTMIGGQIRDKYKTCPLGINVLRNDAKAALAIATALEADFIRVNVHSGVMVTNQGLLPGKAHETLRYRAILGSKVQVFADVFVKHATPLGPQMLSQVAKDTYWRAKADALIVSGPGTGEETRLEDVKTVKLSVKEAPVLVGSGVTLSNIPGIFEHADGVIVGTFFKKKGITTNPVDSHRVRTLMRRVKTLRTRIENAKQ